MAFDIALPLSVRGLKPSSSSPWKVKGNSTESGGDHDTVTLRPQGGMTLDLRVSRPGDRLSHRTQSSGPRSPSLSLLSSLQLSLHPYYPNCCKRRKLLHGGGGGTYKSVLLTSNFLTALKPSPLCLQTLFMISLNIKSKSPEQAYAPYVSAWGLFVYLTEKKNFLIIYWIIHKQYGGRDFILHASQV